MSTTKRRIVRGTVRERLNAYLAPCADPACGCSGCLLWTGRIHQADGYGRIMIDGKSQLVHRVAWQLDNGPIPPGLVLDHVRARGCLHRNCADVAHLEPVTQRENLLRGNSLQAKNAAKTHCDSAHEFTAANTYVWRGMRQCRACARASRKARRPSPT